MCSIGSDNEFCSSSNQDTVGFSKQSEGTCKKCFRVGEVFKVQLRQAECRDCFLIYAKHKFRAAIGASKALPRQSHVLVAYDGSLESLVLLDMLHDAQAENTFKRLQCTVKVLYIDEYNLHANEWSSDEQKDMLTLSTLRSRYANLDIFVLPFSDAINLQPLDDEYLNNYLNRNSKAEKSFKEKIDSIRNVTSKLEFIKMHRKRMIAAAAKLLDCRFVFLADTCNKLAVDLLSAIALGRGGSAALDISVVDDRLEGMLKLIRPLRDLTDKEIELYAHALHLNSANVLNKRTNGYVNCLQSTTSSFISNLQNNYASTVPTVYSVGNKIDLVSTKIHEMYTPNNTKMEPQEEFNTCSFCNGRLEPNISPTLQAIEFSSYVSQHRIGTGDQNSRYTASAISNGNLCHGCSRIQNDSDFNIIQFDQD